uniref:ATP synthase subunit d, mitochondrial n=1 Tax=Hadrurus spadix TaxID=141984 RepID=A0A1W7RAX3_9SCOR
MAMKRIGTTLVDWHAFAERVPPNQWAMFQAFKARSDGYLRRVLAYPEEPPKINWAYYRSHVAQPGLVDDFEKSYNALKVPYPSEKVTPEIDSQQKEAEKQAMKYINQSKETIAKYQKELDALNAVLPFDQMTMEDFKDAFPQYALDPVNRPTFWPHELEEEKQPGSESDEAEKPQVATA